MTDATLDLELDAFVSDVTRLLALPETQRLMRLRHPTPEEVGQQALVRSLVRQLEDMHFALTRELAGTDAAAVRSVMPARDEADA